MSKVIKKQSGAARLCESMISQALLNCKVTTIQSLIMQMDTITGKKFEVTQCAGPELLEEPGPWVVQLMIGNTKVIVKFTVNEKYFITKIEVEG